jgi:hemin uptake protein HemP
VISTLIGPGDLEGLPELDVDSMALLNGRGEIIVAHHTRVVTRHGRIERGTR